MSWDSATDVLYSATPTIEQIDALSKFVADHADELKLCYAPEFSERRPVVARFVSRLFVLLEREKEPETDAEKQLAKAVERAADLLTREEFFKNVFHHALHDHDVALLELVYSALFTEIVFNSDLTTLWFEERLAAERSSASKPSAAARALNLLISVQFLDIRQDWASVKPPAELLLSIQSHIDASKDVALKLVWTLALYFMAQQHYTTTEDRDDGINIEPLMRQLELKAGVHWSQVLKDQLQVSLVGLEPLVSALAVVRRNHTLQFVSSQLFAQTVADVVSCLFAVSKPTESLCAALTSAVEPFPGLQRVPWVPAKHLALIKSKCPSSIGSLVSIAQVLDMATRVDYLREMHTYVSVVNACSLDIDASFLENPVLGHDVRTTEVVSVLPPRITDNQGTLELSPDTRGTLLAVDGTDCLVMWYFTYNGWSLLGRIFENADLIEGDIWKPLTVELLKLISITVDVNVLTAMSAGLSRGDIVDMMANRLQSWVHSGNFEHVELVFDFLAQFALIDSARVWAILSRIAWTPHYEILRGVSRLVLAVWPTFNKQLSLHVNVMNTVIDLYSRPYFLKNDVSALEVFEVFLPESSTLQDNLLGASPLRDITVAPLLANIDKVNVLRFCRLCIEMKNAAGWPQSFLEKQIFTRSSEITELFVSGNHALREPILQLWTALVDNAEAPPLLAFLGKGQATQLKTELVNVANNKLESSSLVASLARFVVAAQRQESLLYLVKEGLLPSLESRLEAMEDPVASVPVMEALKLSTKPLRASTLKVLEAKVSETNDEEDVVETRQEITSQVDTVTLYENSDVKRAAIELLTQQLKIGLGSALNDFVTKIDRLTPNIVRVAGARTSLHSRLFKNLKSKWPSVADPGDTTATFELNLNRLDNDLDHDPIWRSSYRPEVVEAITNKTLIQRQSEVVAAWCRFLVVALKSAALAPVITPNMLAKWVSQLLGANSIALPINLQGPEDERTSAALAILQDPRCEKTVDLLELAYSQLIDLTMSPNAELPVLKPRLVATMNMALIILISLGEKDVTKSSETESAKLTPILSGLLDVVVIKQLQIFGASEDTLQLHLLILSHCLKFLKSLDYKPQELIQSMIESGSDSTILNDFVNTPVENPWKAELILTYIQEWLRSGVMMDTFVRNGLISTLIDSPLSRYIQNGGIISHLDPKYHSLWRRGILPTMALLIRELDNRISEELRLFMENYAAQIATCLDQWKTGMISSALIDETWILSTITRSVELSDNSAADTQAPRFDEEELVKTIEVLLSHQNYLRSRMSPNSDAEAVIEELQALQSWLKTRHNGCEFR